MGESAIFDIVLSILLYTRNLVVPIHGNDGIVARGFSGEDRRQDVDQPNWNGRLQKSTLHLGSLLQQDTPGSRQDAVGLRLQEAHRAGMKLLQ